MTTRQFIIIGYQPATLNYQLHSITLFLRSILTQPILERFHHFITVNSDLPTPELIDMLTTLYASQNYKHLTIYERR